MAIPLSPLGSNLGAPLTAIGRLRSVATARLAAARHRPILPVMDGRYTAPYLSLISSLLMVWIFGGPPPCISLRG
jgi:hypothetical protein